MANTSLDTPPGRNNPPQPEESNPLRRISVNNLSSYLTVGSALVWLGSILWLMFGQLSGVPLGICLGLLFAFTFVLVMVGIFVVQNRPSESIGGWLPNAPTLPDEDARRGLPPLPANEAKKLQDRITELEQGNSALVSNIKEAKEDAGQWQHKVETLNTELISRDNQIIEKEVYIKELEGKNDSLERKHQNAVMGYERGYDDLKKEYDKLERRLENWQRFDWLVSLATVHANDISDYVVVERLYFCYHELTGDLPFIVFGVDIFNKSVFNVTIENSINGHIEIAGKPLLRDKRFTHNPSKISPMSKGELTIEHRLSPEEAALIAKRDKDIFGSFFYFDKLIVMVGSGTQFPSFERTQLKLPQFLGSNDTPVATEIASLKVQQEKNKWLHDIAKDQAETIYRFVSIEPKGFGRHELLRNEPYVEFSFYFDNRSVYDLRLEDLRGSIFFGKRELSGQLKWIDKPDPMTHSNCGLLTFRQTLTEEDAVHILNGTGDEDRFDFDRLGIPVEGATGFKDVVVSQALPVYQSLTSQGLRPAYPKLNVEVQRSTFEDCWNFTDVNSQGLLINLHMRLVNPRETRIEVQRFSVEVEVNNTRFVAYAEAGELYEHRVIDEKGVEQFHGHNLKNLNPPNGQTIRLENEDRCEGWLQFVIAHGVLDMLSESKPGEVPATIPASLTITDIRGEKHRVRLSITYEKFSELYKGLPKL